MHYSLHLYEIVIYQKQLSYQIHIRFHLLLSTYKGATSGIHVFFSFQVPFKVFSLVLHALSSYAESLCHVYLDCGLIF